MLRQWGRVRTLLPVGENAVNWQNSIKFRTFAKLKANQQNSPETTGTSSKNGSGRLMRAWEIHSYSGPADLQLTTTAKVPIIKNPKDLIVEVKASSVNPIDILMTSGYGAGTINVLRHLDSPSFCERPHSILSTLLTQDKKGSGIIEFPLTLGRDFSGVVTEAGNDVREFGIGDEVFGVLGVQRNGSHADRVLTSADMVRRKPKNLSFAEAASLPYAGLTAWSAIHITGGYSSLNRKKFLILGGSGGVGTFAIQYLRASGAYVVSTCSPDALELLGELGCHFAIDYKDGEYLSHIQQQAPFDCILDLSGATSREDLLKFLSPTSGQYITLSSPFMSNGDKYGFLPGLAVNLNDLLLQNFQSLRSKQVLTKWGFFIPCSQGLDSLASVAESGKVKPVIQQTFGFQDVPKAYEKLAAGHSRGKVVIDFN